MILRETQGMFAEDLNDSAIGNLAAAALSNHAFEFGFERVQARDAAFYRL